MKKALVCILLNLLGLGAIAAAFFIAQNGAPLFWLVLGIMVGACFLLSPYKPLVMFGICLVFVLLGFAVAFVVIVKRLAFKLIANVVFVYANKCHIVKPTFCKISKI